MKANSKFQPVYGSQKAIDKEAKVSGQLHFSTEGKIFLDTDDGVRIPIADKTQTLVHHQTTSSDEWVINHNLGRYPTITIHDGSGNEIIGDISYTSDNSLTIKFSKACTGTVYIN